MDEGLTRRAAEHLWSAHGRREDYANLPTELAPGNIDEAYAIQDAFQAMAERDRGPIAGWKIATTTKVMQTLMGIGHPCAGAIFESTVHRSPARLVSADYVSLKIECELAFRLRADLAPAGRPFTPGNVGAAVESVMPAFELIDDRNAVYKESAAWSLIADNCWNQGVVLGQPLPLAPGQDPDGLAGRLEIAGRPAVEGAADGPLQALAWVANLIAARRGGLKRGMIVMTGSLIPTTKLGPGQSARFSVAGIGEVRLEVS
jgi:2-keto-4-pentenoate hydratase